VWISHPTPLKAAFRTTCRPTALRPPAVYPMQTGKQHAVLIARHRAPLLTLASTLTDCCNVLGDVFVQNAPVRCCRWGRVRKRRDGQGRVGQGRAGQRGEGGWGRDWRCTALWTH